MKKTIALIIVFMLIFGLCSCGYEKLPWSVSDSDLADIDISHSLDVIVNITEGTLSASGGEFKMTNCADSQITFGAEYHIQIFKDNEWKDIVIENDGVSWNLLLHMLDSGMDYTQSIDWTYIYGELPEGRYRYVKQYELNGNKYYTGCEFEIK